MLNRLKEGFVALQEGKYFPKKRNFKKRLTLKSQAFNGDRRIVSDFTAFWE
jgi:hypothetical protein